MKLELDIPDDTAGRERVRYPYYRLQQTTKWDFQRKLVTEPTHLTVVGSRLVHYHFINELNINERRIPH